MKQGSTLITDPPSKADLLNSFFDSKQSRVSIDLPHTCHPETKHSSFDFRFRSVDELLMYLDAYGGVDLLGFFPHFFYFKEIAMVFSLNLSVTFRCLLREEGSFPSSWRCAMSRG